MPASPANARPKRKKAPPASAGQRFYREAAGQKAIARSRQSYIKRTVYQTRTAFTSRTPWGLDRRDERRQIWLMRGVAKSPQENGLAEENRF
jgi:hypothetical protein